MSPPKKLILTEIISLLLSLFLEYTTSLFDVLVYPVRTKLVQEAVSCKQLSVMPDSEDSFQNLVLR